MALAGSECRFAAANIVENGFAVFTNSGGTVPIRHQVPEQGIAGMEQTNPIRLTKRVLGEFNISTRSACRLLSSFQQAGIVMVDRQRGRGPDVTLTSPTRGITADE